MNIARQNAYFSGAVESYSTDQVVGQNDIHGSSNSNDDSNYYGNYNKSFPGGMNGNIFLGQPCYNNPKNNLHNNIRDNVLNEQIFENKLFIDSEIRDYSKYPDPFKFIVKFNAIEPSTESVYIEINGEMYSYNKYIRGDSMVTIDRTFKNIKTVYINVLILPHSIEFETKSDGSYEKSGKYLEKASYKYILLKIHELSNERFFSNNKAFGKESFIMKLDDESCLNFHRWIPISNNVAYPDSKLHNIDRLTIEICNDKGMKIYPKLDGEPHDFYGEYQKLIDKMIVLKNRGNGTEIKKLVPKLNSLKYITSFLSPELHLTICTLDPQINTLPKYKY